MRLKIQKILKNDDELNIIKSFYLGQKSIRIF